VGKDDTLAMDLPPSFALTDNLVHCSQLHTYHHHN